MNKKQRISIGVLSTIAATLVVAFASGAIQIGGDKETLVVARKFARDYLANPDKQAFPIYGESKLLVPCLEPRIENEFVSHGKLRYDFKVTCANEKIGYLFVSMKGNPVAYIGVSRESPIVGK